MVLEAGDLILIAFFTGIGTGIGNPVGQWVFERFIKHSVRRLTELDIAKVVGNNYPSMRLLDNNRYERERK
jgi:hypothetical protein